MGRIAWTGWFVVNPNPVAFSMVSTQTQRRLGLGGFAAAVGTSTTSLACSAYNRGQLICGCSSDVVLLQWNVSRLARLSQTQNHINNEPTNLQSICHDKDDGWFDAIISAV